MTNTITLKRLNELIAWTGNIMTAHGFREPRPLTQCLMLIVTEVSEAVEADRKHKRTLSLTEVKTEAKFKEAFEQHVKNTVEDEFADIVIRVLDMAGQFGIDIASGYAVADKLLMSWPVKERAFIENAWQFTKAITGGPITKQTMYLKLLNVIKFIELWSDLLNIDLWLHVELKLKYNELRPYKHGKAY